VDHKNVSESYWPMMEDGEAQNIQTLSVVSVWYILNNFLMPVSGICDVYPL
jgi:hypothetical protein